MTAEINQPNEDSEELMKLASAFTEQWPFLDVQLDLIDHRPAMAVKFTPASGDLNRIVRYAMRGDDHAAKYEQAFKDWARAKITEVPRDGMANGRSELSGTADDRLRYIHGVLRDWASHDPIKRQWLGLCS